MSGRAQWRASPGQMNIWFEEVSGTGGRSNVNVALLKIEGHIDGDSLRAAVDKTLASHPALHLRFEEINGVLYQTLDKEPAPPTRRHEITVSPLDAAIREALLIGRSVADVPLSPQQGRLYNAAVISPATDLHFVVLAISMLVSDGRSMALLYHDLLSRLRGEPDRNLRPNPVASQQSADAPDAAQVEGSLAFWKDRLDGRRLNYPWPVAEPLASAAHTDGFVIRLTLSEAESETLDGFARQRDTTRYALIAAAVALVLQRIIGSPEIPFVLPLDGRNAKNSDTVGHFLRVVPCVATLDPDRGFGAAVDAMTQALLDSSRHQWVDLSELRARLSSTSARDGIASVMIAQNNAPSHGARIGRLLVTPLRFNNHTSKFDLSALVNVSGPISLEVTFRKSLFAPDFAQNLMAQIRDVLGNAVRRPEEQPVPEPALNPDSPSGLEDNERHEARPQDSLCALIFRSAEIHPDAVALAAGDIVLTYRELASRISRAHASLLLHRPKPGEPILLAAGRGVGSYVGFLAILTGGWVATPVDPAWPPARLEDVRRTVGARFLCGDVDQMVKITDVETIDLNAAGPAEMPVPALFDLDSPAYIIFTSGTSGRAKAVVGTDRALANLSRTAAAFSLGPGRRVAQYAGLFVDAALWDLCVSLTSGASLIVLSDEQRLSPTTLQSMILRERLDVIKIPPSILAAFDPAGPAAPVTIVAGESCPLSLAQAWAGRTKLFNAYGPTEAGVWASIERLVPGERRLVTAGRPIQGAAISVRDKAMHLLPRAAWGEVWIAGQGLANGYLNEPRRTERDYRTLTDLGHEPRRWYRTGDRGRLLPDGRLEIAGRFDRMFKLHGQRIHPEEIEAQIRSATSAVRRALVLGAPASCPERLLAFIEVDEGNETALKAAVAYHLRQVLPPALALVELRSVADWPQTAGGKTDIAALLSSAALPLAERVNDNARCGDESFFYELGYPPAGYLPLTAQPSRPRILISDDERLRTALGAVLTSRDTPLEFCLPDCLDELDAVSAQGETPRLLVLALGLLESDMSGEELLESLHAQLAALTRAASAPGQRGMELWLLVNGLFRIGQDEPLVPEARLPLAWLKAAAIELPEVSVKLLDFGSQSHRPATTETWKTALGALIGLPTGSVRIFRSGRLYSRQLSLVPAPARLADEPPWSTAVFFGGGDIAHAFAVRLARQRRVFVFASRSSGAAEHLELETKRIEELRRLGADASFVRCDLRNIESIAQTFREVTQSYGRPGLIGHFAANSVGKSVLTTTAREILDQYRTKALGLSRIIAMAREHAPQARVLCLSSAATFAGGFGSYAYGFGNMALEAVAEGPEADAQAVATGRWRGIGMASALSTDARISASFSETIDKGYSAEAGSAALEIALSMRRPLVFMSALPLPLTEPNEAFLGEFRSPTGILAGSQKQVRPASLLAAYVAPRTPLEAWLAKRFADVLYVAEVGVMDDFFALGGHSLMAADLAARLSEDFRISIGLATIFRASNVERLALALTSASESSGSIDQLAAALLHLSVLPEEAVDALQ
ncbi:SDR family oxidoreductase [Bradyrhizobium sp. SZCCHNR1051]|uniref:SDR family oxidoreductase n=1 Tax=Bradyrhizobium sp. SZCCHNR1051 TaxID=3057355 RepID=UPI002916528D|nr:SDR family oxidoreductase [Bradyrhizobium sp. SZCCHNR1051]